MFPAVCLVISAGVHPQTPEYDHLRIPPPGHGYHQSPNSKLTPPLTLLPALHPSEPALVEETTNLSYSNNFWNTKEIFLIASLLNYKIQIKNKT